MHWFNILILKTVQKNIHLSMRTKVHDQYWKLQTDNVKNLINKVELLFQKAQETGYVVRIR